VQIFHLVEAILTGFQLQTPSPKQCPDNRETLPPARLAWPSAHKVKTFSPGMGELPAGIGNFAPAGYSRK
jgi:hypothetical protein